MKESEFDVLCETFSYEFTVPLLVALNPELSATDLRVYFVLSNKIDKEGRCSITNKSIAEMLEMQPSGVQESIDRLTSWNFITVYADENEDGSYNRIIVQGETAYHLYGDKNDDFYRRLHEVEEE